MNYPPFLRSRFAAVLGLLLLIVPGLVHAYLLMPFPGSQDLEAIRTAYVLEGLLPFARILGAAFLVVPFFRALNHGKLVKRLVVLLAFIAICGIYYMTDVVFSAQHMFREPSVKEFRTPGESDLEGDRIVVGIEHGGVAKAYPINYIGYHHKVQDTVGGMPVLVTYCTMCRTARVYNPVIDGKHEEFRLVGARHYNAVIEDASTGSWWYQATGEAAAGPMRGTQLQDIPYEQVTLRSWVERHPSTLVLQPDQSFAEEYADLEGYDRTQRVQLDSSGMFPTWQRRNWVVGILLGGEARAYDWNDLAAHRVINDSVGGSPIVVVVEGDTSSYHAWKRIAGGKTLEFTLAPSTHTLNDNLTGSVWNFRGECVSGSLNGSSLDKIQASQEYWHSWKHFHPQTSRWIQ